MKRLAHSINMTVGDLLLFSSFCIARFIVWRELRRRRLSGTTENSEWKLGRRLDTAPINQSQNL